MVQFTPMVIGEPAKGLPDEIEETNYFIFLISNQYQLHLQLLFLNLLRFF